MATPRGQTVYKKKDGILTVAEDQSRVIWTPNASGTTVTLETANITIMLKIFEKAPGSEGDPSTYLFLFNAPSGAREEARAIKDLLSKILADIRSHDPNVPQPVASAAQTQNAASTAATTATAAAAAATTTTPERLRGVSGSMSFATASSKPATARWFDDNQLKTDIELQQSLMKKDKELHRTYMDAQRSKPESISDATFNYQFWSTRTNLLRAHAIETNQKKGAYNVLSTVKPRTVDGELKLNISVEQVQMILSQHPLVQRIYNENVPRVSEAAFWSRFFLSRLSKKLRGERVLDSERADPLFDRYDETDDDTLATNRILSSQVPHTIDLEGNEEDQGGFKGGNRQDVEMRPRSNIPIVRTLNSLSEKIMASVAPSDRRDDAIDVDQETQDELTLRDLRGDVEARRIVLNVREQSQFFSSSNDSSKNRELYAKQVPSEVLFDVQADIDTLEDDGAGGIDLHTGLGIDEDSDSDDEGRQQQEQKLKQQQNGSGATTTTTDRVGSRAARRAAQKQILHAISQRRAELYGHSADDQKPMGIPADIAQRAYMTNATTTEFLKQFWNAFLSGDPDRAQELAYHVESLAKCMTRIDAIADEAETARNAVIDEKKEEIRVLYGRTGKRIRWRPEMIGGGKKAIRVLLGPTIHSLEMAQGLYRDALAAEGLKPTTEV